MRRELVAAAIAALISVAASARADDASGKAAAQALFESARQLMAQEKYAEACPKLAESQHLDPGAGTLLNLGACYEKLGQTASAWVTFKDAAAEASLKHRDDWAQKARERAKALEPRLSRLTIEVPADERSIGLQIRRDGLDVGSAEWGLAIPIDPGNHVLEASAPARQRWSMTAAVRPNGDQMRVVVPELQDGAQPQPAPLAQAQANPVAPPDGASALRAARSTPGEPALPAEATPESHGSSQADRGASERTLGLVVGGVGVAGVAVGSVFGFVALGKSSSAKTLCPTTASSCSSQAGVQDNTDANTAATVSTVAMIAGGAALVTGAVIYVLSPKRPASGALRVEPTFAARGAGLALGGVW